MALRPKDSAAPLEDGAPSALRDLIDLFPDLVALTDAEGRLVQASLALRDLLGHEPDPLRGSSLFDLVHPEDVSGLRGALTAPGGAVSPGDLRVRHRDGSWRVLELTAARLPDGGLLLAGRDVSERRGAERALRASEERYSLAAAGADDGLWDWDLVSDRLYVSPRWRALVGSPVGRGEQSDEWFGRVHPEDVPGLRTALAAHLEGRTPRLEHEHRVLLPEGGPRWMLARGLAVRGADGRPVRIAGFLTDVSARKAAEDLLLHQAVHDALTGLPNRAAFADRLERSIARARRRPEYRFAVLYLDIDRFKLVNDSLGHLAGDQLLVGIARRLVATLRPGDMVAHLGGDEFAVLADHLLQPDDASHIAERIQRGLAQPFSVAEQDVYGSASIGIALSSSGYERPEELLRDADTAMYRAKSQGSGRYEMFDRAMHQRVLSRLRLETDLRRAVERGELRLHYQPIVALADGSISGFEALVRWQHPERGLVGPMEFIPVAEETDLILPICLWVVAEACRQTREWRERHPGRPLAISVNFTSTHFTDPGVMTGVEQALASAGLEGDALHLEITESVMMKDIDSVVAVLLALKSLEIGLDIDDFGTGYSSLSYLQRLPTDSLKIDRSFVARIGSGRDPGADVIVRTIVEMAHTLGRKVIAEGIESAEQLACLRALGCEYGQGYFFAKPLPPGEAEALLARDPRW